MKGGQSPSLPEVALPASALARSHGLWNQVQGLSLSCASLISKFFMPLGSLVNSRISCSPLEELNWHSHLLLYPSAQPLIPRCCLNRIVFCLDCAFAITHEMKLWEGLGQQTLPTISCPLQAAFHHSSQLCTLSVLQNMSPC